MGGVQTWTVTLELSKALFDECYHLETGQLKNLSDTIYENVTIIKDNNKVTIQIQDNTNIILQEKKSTRYSAIIQVGYNGDPWLKKFQTNETINEDEIKIESNTSTDVDPGMQECPSNLASVFEQQSADDDTRMDDSNSLSNTVSKDQNIRRIERIAVDEEQSLGTVKEVDDSNQTDCVISSKRSTKKRKKKKAVTKRRKPQNKTTVISEKLEKVSNRIKSPTEKEKPQLPVHEKKDDLSKSKHVNNGGPPFKCVIESCGKVFKYSRCLLTHTERCHKSSSKNKPIKMVKFRWVQCPLCKIDCTYGSHGIEKHLKTVHETEDNLSALIEKIRQDSHKLDQLIDRISCEICGKILKKTIIRRHLKSFHQNDENIEEAYKNCPKGLRKRKKKDKPQEIPIKQEKIKVEQRIACSFCGTVLTKHYMTTHMKLCNSNPDKISFIFCPCGYKAVDKEKMATHKEKCINVTYLCDLCGKSCKSRSTMIQHRKFFHGVVTKNGTQIKSYKCDHCDQTFHLPCRLRRHIRKHNDVRSCMCNICGSTYKTQLQLKHHKEIVHEGKYRHHCEKCGHGIMKKERLKTHICGRVRRKMAQPLKHPLAGACKRASNKQTSHKRNTSSNQTQPEENKFYISQLQYENVYLNVANDASSAKDEETLSTKGETETLLSEQYIVTSAPNICSSPLLSEDNPADLSEITVSAGENSIASVNQRLLANSNRKLVSDSLYLAPNLHSSPLLSQVTASNFLSYSIPSVLVPIQMPDTDNPMLTLPLFNSGTRDAGNLH